MALELNAARAGLLLLDMQRDFLHPEGFFARQGWWNLAASEVALLIHNCRRLIAAMHTAGRSVVFVNTAFRADYADCALPRTWAKRGLNAEGGALVEGSWGAEVMDGLAPEPGDHVLIKKGHSAFQHTYLDRLLANLGVVHCVVAGGDVPGSVSDTVRMGAALGYEQFLVEDALYPRGSAYLPMLKIRAEYVTTDQIVSVSDAPSALPLEDHDYRCALILVDLQNDFLHPQGAMISYGYSRLSDSEREGIVANNRKLIEAMHRLGLPVVFVKIGRRADAADSAQAPASRRLRPMPPEAHYMETGFWGTELVDGLEPGKGDLVIEKKGHSAFAFTPLRRILRNLGVRRCLVTGGAVSGCLSDTVREGAGLGYEITVVSDAVYPPNSPYLQVLAERVEVHPTEVVLAELGAMALI